MGAAGSVATDIRERFKAAGFEVVEAAKHPASIEIKKNNCARELLRESTGAWQASGPPHFIVRGLKCELEDRGYQKFWYIDGKRFPIKQNDLKTLHRFDEEVRAILGLKSLYNEALGSTCARSVYDRVHGRPDQ
jgi:hypothetical protein